MKRRKSCAFCGDHRNLVSVEDGSVCRPCFDHSREGRDDSTKAAKHFRWAQHHLGEATSARVDGDSARADECQHDADLAGAAGYALAGVADIPSTALGEVVPEKRPILANTMTTPDKAALDASSHRIELVTRMGTDVAAMALDASHSIQAQNSLEKMLAHQLALAHKAAMETIDKAFFVSDAAEKARLLNVGARLMETFQKGLLVIQKLRSGGEQTINVQHVHVSDGGQAIVGSVQTGSSQK